MGEKVRSRDDVEPPEQVAPRVGRRSKRSVLSSLRDLNQSPVPRAAGNLAVQRASKSASPTAAPSHLQATAQKGVSGASGPLPHRERIQSSFGSANDLSGVRAHVGGPASDAAADLNAHAFTTGDHIAFATEPSLRLAAHEATHVVQQRHGVNLAGGVDHPRDPYERHADAVAERVAGGRSAADLLAAFRQNAGGARVVQREQADAESPSQKIQRLIGDGDGSVIVALSDTELAASTAGQRAGMVRILADQTWTSENDERVMLRLIRFNGQHQEVIGALDALGYRQSLLDTVDTETLHTELETLLVGPQSVAVSPDDPIARALGSREPRDVMAVTDFSRATLGQCLGLLHILLDMSSSNAAEEAKIVDILESSGSGLAELMTRIRDLGLKQRLFDHIDDDANKVRLTTLLQSLNDAELNRDLEVFNRGGIMSFLYAIGGGLVSAWEKFSIVGLVMGLAQPLLHPIDTLLHLVDEVAVAIKNPSWDTILTALRDIAGALAMWCLALSALSLLVAGLFLLLAVALSKTVVLGALCLAVASFLLSAFGFFFVAAKWCGIAFLVLAAIKLLVDIIQGTAATTKRELVREQEQIGEGLTLAVVVGLVWALTKVAGRVARRLKGPATDPDAVHSEKIREDTAEVKKDEAEGQQHADELKEQQKAAEEQQKAPEEQPKLPEEQPKPAEEPAKAAEEQAKKVAEETKQEPAKEEPREQKPPSPEEVARELLKAAAAAVRQRIAALRHRLREIQQQTRDLQNISPQDRATLQERAREIGRRLDGLEKDVDGATSADEVKEILDPEAARAETDVASLAEDMARAGAAAAAPAVPRPHLSHPKDKLPTRGTHPYRSPQPGPEVAPNPEGAGYLDADGNVWQVDRTKTEWHEWDVQHPDGTHTNVGVSGEVTHGPDNF